MTVDLLLGLQWGDEGKGKIVDVLTSKYDIIARFQGGPNAGHTLEFDGIKHVLRTIPSGIFHKSAVNVIGNGVVIDPVVFQKEIEGLAKFNIDIKAKLIISLTFFFSVLFLILPLSLSLFLSFPIPLVLHFHIFLLFPLLTLSSLFVFKA